MKATKGNKAENMHCSRVTARPTSRGQYTHTDTLNLISQHLKICYEVCRATKCAKSSRSRSKLDVCSAGGGGTGVKEAASAEMQSFSIVLVTGGRRVSLSFHRGRAMNILCKLKGKTHRWLI